jgi:hypothetical protein
VVARKPQGADLPSGARGQGPGARGQGPGWARTPPARPSGISYFFVLGPAIFRNKGHSTAFASRHRRSEARHVRGFAGRFRDFWPRAVRSAARVRLGPNSSFVGRKRVGGVHALATPPDILRAAFLILRPSTCLFTSSIMYRNPAVAGTHRLSQSPTFGALYADR